MGRQGDRQGALMVMWSEMPRSPGHVFYDRLQEVLLGAGFDGFVEEACRAFYAKTMGAPSLPPGRYFRMHMVGYFEGIDSERGIKWRCSDSFSLREFLRLEATDRVPDHSWLSKTRGRLSRRSARLLAQRKRLVVRRDVQAGSQFQRPHVMCARVAMRQRVVLRPQPRPAPESLYPEKGEEALPPS